MKNCSAARGDRQWEDWNRENKKKNKINKENRYKET